MQSVVKSYTNIIATGALAPIAIPDSARSFGLRGFPSVAFDRQIGPQDVE